MARTVLVVDDDAALRRSVARLLEGEGYAVRQAASGVEALEALDHGDVDLVVTDLSMPDMGGLELLEALRERPSPPQTLVVSGDGTVQNAVRAVQLGALDFVEKPIRPERLLVTVENALRYSRLAEAHARLREEVALSRRLLGEAPALRQLRARIVKVAASEGRVLIAGENGTGKELVAAAIHESSSRRDGPFVKLNCAAVPESLVESELFGHEKGSFTGATGTRRGRFELADGGTLFLDEIGDMPAAMQVKLLRVLQEGQLERVGGSQTIEVDVRVIAASNRDLEALVSQGAFREDLYYRLAVVTIAVPPLRERAEDIPALARHFADAVAERQGRPPIRLTAGALAALSQHEFPGNVRELQNVVERIAILTDAETVTEAHALEALPALRGGPAREAAGPYRPGASLKELVAAAERRIVSDAIAAHDGNKTHAARALGVERSHFNRKCKKLGLD